MPHYSADAVLELGDDGSSAYESKEAKLIELPILSGVYELVEIVPPKPLDQEHTIHTAKPKKQKKKRVKRPVLLPDDEPIKQIEIIRSQPEETPKTTKGKAA